MAQIRLIPSTYSVSNNVVTVSNPSNMYANTDNTTKATVTHTQKATTTYYIYLKGFNFSAIDPSWTINSFTVKFKAYESGLSTSSSYRPYLVNNTSTLTCSCSTVSSSTKTLTFTGVTASWSTIKGYGNNFGIRISVRRSNKNTQGYLYIYGAEILVDYTDPSASKTCTITYNGRTIATTTETNQVNITYNGNTIASNVTGTKTLNCNGKVMASNVTVGSKTLNCNGKLMASNIVVNVS